MTSCKIIRNPQTNNIDKVLAPNGKESMLYKSILNTLPEKIELDSHVQKALQTGFIKDNSKEEVALALWSKVYSNQFKKWFGDSKIVDKNGEPQLMFHGSPNVINTFKKPGQEGYVKQENTTTGDAGIYFTDTQAIAEKYRDFQHQGIEGYLYPVFLKAEKPITVGEKPTDGISSGLGASVLWNIQTPMLEAFKKNGIDAIKSGAYASKYSFMGSNVEVAVFEPNQVKSLFNKGEFSLQTQDIYYDLDSSELSKIDPTLEQNINSFLKSLGVDIKIVDKIRNRNGKIMNAYGKANLTTKVIELVKGRSAKTLPEEAAHMITAILGPNHPLIKQMMQDIVNYPQYQEVKDTYANVYSTEQEFKFEAIGKVIADLIIKDKNSPISGQKSKTKSWFDRVILILSRMFNKVNTQKPKEILDGFHQIANTIKKQDNELLLNEIKHSSELNKIAKIKTIATSYNMNNQGFMSSQINPDLLKQELRKKGLSDITVSETKNGKGYYFKMNGKKFNPFTEYFDLQNTPSQDEITSKLLDSNNKLKGIVEREGKDRYQLTDDTVLENRVSDAQKRLFEKGKTKEQVEKLQNTPKSILARELGTELHDLAENTFNFILSNNVINNIEIGNPAKINKSEPAKPQAITLQQQVELTQSVKWLADEISKQQNSIDSNGKARVFTENFVIDKDKSLGGSQDVIVIFSDGSASIYDYKFINFKTEKKGKTFEVPEGTEINFMKEKSYNLQLSEYKRILQDVYGINKIRATRILPFNIQYESKKGVFTGKVKTLEGFKTDKSYLMPLPVANELTDNKYVNNILNELFKQQKLLEERLTSNYGTELFQQSKNELEKLKASIKRIQVLNDFRPLFNSINITLDNESDLMKDITVDNISELNRMDSEIKLFKTLHQNILMNIKDKDLKEELSKISDRLTKAEISITQKRNKLLSEINPEINDIQKQISALKSLTGYTNEIGIPVFDTLSDITKKVHFNKNKALTQLNSQLDRKHNALEKWAKNRGISMFDTFRKLIEDGHLVNMFSKEFYKERKEKREQGDIEWFKKNYKVTEEAKERYKKDLEKQKNVLKLTFKENSNLYKVKLESWINNNNLENDSAWLNKYAIMKYAELKKPEVYYSSKYKELLLPANKELLDYYEFYMQTNKDLNLLVDERIDSNFIANVRRDSRELLSNRRNLLTISKQFIEDLKSSLKVYQDDGFITSNNVELKIPLLYYNQIKVNKDGQWVTDKSEKSEDLSKSLMMFANSVYLKNELVKIEGIVESLKLHLSTQPVYKTDRFGKIVFENGEPQLDDINGKPTDLFDTHVKALIYGEKIQNNDTIIAKEYSTNKLLKNVMSYFSLNTLALSYVSAFGNLTAGTAGIFFKANGKTFFNQSQVMKSLKLMASKGEDGKFYKISEYFNIESENWVHNMASNLSASKIVKNMTLDKAYVLWQKGENFLSNTILVSMAQNYGIDPESKKVKRLELLPEGTKSLYDMFEVKDDKLISGLTDDQFIQFRSMVTYLSRKIKGSNTTEEMSKIQTHIFGKAVMFFKNWLPQMTAERFDGIKYTKDLNEFEYGRYRSFFKELFSSTIHKKLPKLLLDIVTFSKFKYKLNKEEMTEHFNKFIEKNPQLANKMDINDYMELRERTIREAIAELRTLTGLMLLLFAAKIDWDDDGKEFYKTNSATKHSYRLVRRMYLELSFFSNPMSFTEITRNPVPIVSIGTDLIKSMNNGFDETMDILLDNERDNTPYGHHLKKFTPGKPLFRILEDFQN